MLIIIGILQYGAAFLLLLSAHFSKKDIFQKIVAPTFWSICKSKFIFLCFQILLENTPLLFAYVLRCAKNLNPKNALLKKVGNMAIAIYQKNLHSNEFVDFYSENLQVLL